MLLHISATSDGLVTVTVTDHKTWQKKIKDSGKVTSYTLHIIALRKTHGHLG